MANSNVYTVSPPTLHMPAGGITFCLISNNTKWQDSIINKIEKVVNKQLTFFVNEELSIDPKLWVWYWHIVDNCGMIICDTLSATEHEIRMCIAMTKQNLPILFRVKPGNDEFVSLLNAIEIPSFEDDKQLLEFIEVTVNE